MLTTAYVNGVKVSIHDFKKEEVADAYCPLGHKVMAKKGRKVTHHFAHYPNQGCDPWKNHRGMSHWHSQWQKIVADKANLEVCLSPTGEILGHSAFAGKSSFSNIVAAKLDGHIADIIKPLPNNSRPLVVEIQHSSMNKETIDAREAYYQHMVWLFDFTPRLTTIDKCNKIAFIDGSVKYLKEKVTYVAMLSCLDVRPQIHYPQSASNNLNHHGSNFNSSAFTIPATSFDQTETRQQLFNLPITNSTGNNNNLPLNLTSLVNTAFLAKPCKGDECFTDNLTSVGGFFMIISTKTKHWFETTKPTYFDTGFCILRYLMALNGNFILTMYLSYEEFIHERMPPVDQEKINKSEWFKTINPAILIKLGMIPKIIDVQSMRISKNRIVAEHKFCELADLGFSQGMDHQWFSGSFYSNQTQHNPSSSLILPVGATMPSAKTVNPTPLNPNDDMLVRMLNQAKVGTVVNPTAHNVAGEILIIAKVRRFLGLSSTTEVTIVNKRGGEHLVVFCNRETLGLKDKFKTLEMKYKKGINDPVTGGKKMSGKQAIKQTRNAIASNLTSPGPSSKPMTPEKLKKEHKEAFAGESRAHWYAKLSLIENKLANL